MEEKEVFSGILSAHSSAAQTFNSFPWHSARRPESALKFILRNDN